MTGGLFFLCVLLLIFAATLATIRNDRWSYAFGLLLPWAFAIISRLNIGGSAEIGFFSALVLFCGVYAGTAFWVSISGSYLHTTKKGRPDLRYKHNPYLHTFGDSTRESALKSLTTSGIAFLLLGFIAMDASFSQPSRVDKNQAMAAAVGANKSKVVVKKVSEQNRAPAKSDREIRALLIRRSQAGYSGNCPCPDNNDGAGRRCGKRSAYNRAGGASPLCYPSDISQEMIAKFKRGNL